MGLPNRIVINRKVSSTSRSLSPSSLPTIDPSLRAMSSPTEKVLSYLTSQNRPYSVNDIFLNLHKEVGKSAVQKALDLLVADEKVREKVNGKQKAYVVNQDTLETPEGENIEEMDALIRTKTAELNQLKEEQKA